MDEQPKPAPRRTATKTATKTAGGAAKASRTAAKAKPVKAAPKKRTPPKSAPVPEVSTSDPTWSSASPRIHDLIARLGPDARDWVARTRERYPAATKGAVARLAATQRREPAWLVLAVAAAYGVDPTDPARAIDLRDLGIHSGRMSLEGRARARYSQET